MRQVFWLLLLLGAVAANALAQQTAPASPPAGQPHVSFTIDRAGVDVSHFVITVHPDGSGTYDAVAAPPTLSSRYGADPANATSEPIRLEIHLSAAGTAKVFAGARATNLFGIPCNSKARNIADTGHKTLTYAGPDGAGSCVYNYSENKTVVFLTDFFQSVGYTLDEGRRLEFRHRYDRLGLDQEMATLLAQSDAGHAPELATIAPTLESLVADGDLLERVRLRARKLLERARAER